MWMHPHTNKLMETNTNTPEAEQSASAGCHPTTCSASEFHRRYKEWVTSDPSAKRWDAARLRAKKNRCRRNLAARRKTYWGRAQIAMERRLMRKFHSLPNSQAQPPKVG